jgi:uncharacterized protein (DUF608 family)
LKSLSKVYCNVINGLGLIDEWQRPIIENNTYPDWLRQGLLNELYLSTFGGSFWENGCITKLLKHGGLTIHKTSKP